MPPSQLPPTPPGDGGEGDVEPDDAGGQLEILDDEACWVLLRTSQIGRVAVDRADRPPLVVPVNYAVVQDMVVVRSGPGSKLAAMRTGLVTFQVDGFDMAHRTGWSVMAEGEVKRATRQPVEGATPVPWAPGPKPFYVQISIDTISGRHIHLPEPIVSTNGYL